MPLQRFVQNCHRKRHHNRLPKLTLKGGATKWSAKLLDLKRARLFWKPRR
jgi:hypothetical protein